MALGPGVALSGRGKRGNEDGREGRQGRRMAEKLFRSRYKDGVWERAVVARLCICRFNESSIHPCNYLIM